MNPRENSSEQNMCPRAYYQICQDQTLGAPMLEVSEIGGTQGTQQVYYQFDQGQASYTSVGAILETSQIIGGNDEVQVQQDFPAGTIIHEGPEIGGIYAAQQEIPVGTIHEEPEIGGTYGIQQAYNQIHQGQNFWTTRESMLKGSEIGSTNRTQQVYYQFAQGQGPCTPVETILEAANIGGPNETRQELPMGTVTGEPVIGGTAIQGESLSGHYQAFSIPLRTTQKALDFGGTELPEGDEEEGASQTYQNQHTLYVGEQTNTSCHRPHRTVSKKKVIPRACVLNQQNENISSCKSGSDANNSKGKAVLGSLTPIENKRLTDRRYRAKVKAKNQKVRDDFESVSKENVELKEQLHSSSKLIELLLLKNNGQRSVSSKRKAVFELNFDSVENKAEAMKMVGGLPDMVKITLNVKKRRLKLKGDFDVEALLHTLKTCCDAHLLSKEDVSAMPGPSASGSLRVSAVQLR